MKAVGPLLATIALAIGAGMAHAQIVRDTVSDSAATRLKPVTVTATREADAAYLGRSGYVERRRTGHGVYLDGSDLAERRIGAREFSDLLRAIPGVSTFALGGSNGGGFRVRGMESIARPCRLPQVRLDGIVVASNDTDLSWGQLVRELNTVIQLDHLLAIEVYRGPSELPAEYGGADSGCGVILIWTRHSL